MREQSTTRGFAVLSMAGIIVKLLSLFYIPLLVRIIGNEGLGIYTAAYDVYVFIYALTNSGMPTAISKQVAELIALNNSKDAVKTFKIARGLLLGIGTCMAVILIVFAKSIAKLTGNPQSYLAIILLSPAIMLTTILSAYRGYFQGRSLMVPTAVSQVLEQIINVVISLVFAKILFTFGGASKGAAGGTIGTVLGALISGIYLIYIYKNNKLDKSRNIELDREIVRLSNKQILRNIFKYGIPITMSVALQYFGNIIDLTIIKNRLFLAGFNEKSGNIKYGLLGQYKSLINVPIAIISALSAAIIPSISKAVVLGDKKTIRKKINFAFKISYIISIPCAVGFSVLSSDIYRLLYESRYGHELLMYGSVLVILMSIVQIQIVILQCTNKLYLVLLSLSTGILFKLVLNYTLVSNPGININGAVIGNIACFAITMIINNVIMEKELNIKVGMVRLSIKPILSSLFMGVVIKLVNDNLHFIFYKIGNGYLLTAIPVIITIIIGVIIYGYIMILIGGITKSEIKVLPNRLVKLIPNSIIERIK